MFTINEIGTENRNSVFPRMFYFLAKSLSAACGDGGEGAVREAVRRYGSGSGIRLMEAHQERGRKQNVKSYYCASDIPNDSRIREKILCLNEEVGLKEVYTCPYADIWRRYGASDIGNWFCEEYEKAKFEAYTAGYGQAHLSSRLTCDKENHCRFSMYYRMANIPSDDVQRCFTDNRHKDAEDEDYENQFFMGSAKQCLMLYHSFYEAAGERLGYDGICAIARGLKMLANDVIAVMQMQAKHTLCRCDEEFAKVNFPLPLQVTDRVYEEDQEHKDANSILKKNLLDPVCKALELMEE